MTLFWWLSDIHIEYGVEQAVRVEGMDQGQVAKAVQGLVEQESSSS
jgi:hypothetical protein